MTEIQKPLISLQQAIQDITRIDLLVEGNYDVVDAIIKTIGDIGDYNVNSATGFTAAVDRYMHAIEASKISAELFKKYRDKYDAKIKSCKNIEKRIKERVGYFMMQKPDLVFEASDSRKFARQKNGTSRLELKFETYDLKDCVTDEHINEFGIPDDCYKEITVKVLDKAKLKEKLKAPKGSNLPVINQAGDLIEGTASFGELKTGTHVRVR